MSDRKLHPDVVAHTKCPSGHEDEVVAIKPVVRNGEMVEGWWPSAHDFCVECDQPVWVVSVEVVG